MASRRAKEMLKGSCLCGGVCYEIDGEVGPMAHCYCSMCRKQHGASFVTIHWESERW
jgi:hypothetical protein